MRTSRHFALIAGCLLSLFAQGQETIPLRLNLQAGKDYVQRFSTQQTLTQTLFGMEQATKTAFSMTYNYHVVEVEPESGIATLEATYTRVSVAIDNPMLNMAYDSANPPDEIHPALEPYAALVGATFTLQITPDGKVPMVDGMDETITEMLETVDIPESMRAQLEKQMRQQFNDEAVRKLTEQTLAIYPTSPVAKGEAWTRRIDGAGMFPIVIDNTWTLKDFTADAATLAVHSRISPGENTEWLKAQGMALSADMGGTQEGTLELDRKSGWIRQGKLQQKVTGSIALTGEATGGVDLNVPMTMTTVATIDQGE